MTTDGRNVYFDLSVVSHLTSFARKNDDDKSDPLERRALIHFKNGDMYHLEGTYGEWRTRLIEVRKRMLEIAFEVSKGEIE